MVDNDKEPYLVKLERIERKTARIKSADGISSDELDELRATIPNFTDQYRRIVDANRGMSKRLQQDRELLAQASEDREQLDELQAYMAKLESTPLRYGILRSYDGSDEARVIAGSDEMQVAIDPNLSRADLTIGKEVLIDPQTSSIVRVNGYPQTGTSARVKDVIGERLVVATSMGNEEKVVLYVGSNGSKPKAGDLVLLDKTGLVAIEPLPREDRKELYVEEIPPITWNDIGGLGDEIKLFRRITEFPYLHPEIYARYKLSPPKGVLLHGPPGCGKTLLVQALINDMYTAGRDDVVVVFFDEADSLFSARGTGVTVEGGAGSTMSDTIVPQLLAELQGLEELNKSRAYTPRKNPGDGKAWFYNIPGPALLSKWVGESEQTIRDIYSRAKEKGIVLTVLATNRPDKLDPALLREGRIDKKVYIPRPNAEGAKRMFEIYLPRELPVSESELSRYADWHGHAITGLVAYLFDDTESLAHVKYRNATERDLHRRDLISGSKIRSIVMRACEYAAEREAEGGISGIEYDDLMKGVNDSYAEEVEILTTGSPGKWSLILGRDGDDIQRITPASKYSTQEAQPTVYKPRSRSI